MVEVVKMNQDWALGPWKYEPGSVNHYVTSAHGKRVARIKGSQFMEVNDQRIANAKLIASAPSLYAAIQAALFELRDRDGESFSDDVKAARDVLRQALDQASQ